MAEYLKYIIRNEEPLRIADDSVSQSGQTDTLCYIPGSTIRGMVIHAFATKTDLDQNPELKKQLLGDQIAFLNAYPTTQHHSLIPSPKGFYEDKTVVTGKKELPVNVVIQGASVDGMKRAALGRYCYLEDGCICYYSVDTDADMKIKINLEDDTADKQTVFRNNYICSGHFFEGYIRLDGSEEAKQIAEIFAVGKTLIVGNARSAGLGKCKVIAAEKIQSLPYGAVGSAQTGEAYLMLLSNTTMRDDKGELCGMNWSSIEKELGVSNLRVAYCATSMKQIYGYNRTWQSKVPTIPAYEAGSVFHLVYDGTIAADKMEALMNRGIGIRRNEGMGRILFLKDYEKVHQKLACTYSADHGFVDAKKKVQLTRTEKDTLKVIARGYYLNQLNRAMEKYVVENKLKTAGLKKSQMGTVLSILGNYRYNPTEATASLDEYIRHVGDKEENQNIQKKRVSQIPFLKQVQDLLAQDLNALLLPEKSKVSKVMGYSISEIFPKEEEERYKLQLIINMIKYENKGGEQ